MNYTIKITLKDGTVDEIDPVGEVSIFNGYGNYQYALKDIERIEWELLSPTPTGQKGERDE